MLTVACVFVRGEYPYTPTYVYRLKAMVRRWLDRPFRFVCLTDQPEKLPGIERIVVHPPEGAFAFWTKVQLFNPNLGLTGRVLALDLDSIIVAPLDPVVDFKGRFVLATDCLTNVGHGWPEIGRVDRYGRALVQKFQGSVMLWNAGDLSDLYTEWNVDVARRLSTDQDWCGERYPKGKILPLSWTPRISQCLPPWTEDAKIVFCKKPKNEIAVRKWPELEDWWGDGIRMTA